MKKGVCWGLIILSLGLILYCCKINIETNVGHHISMNELFGKEKLDAVEVTNGQDFKLATGDCPCRLTIKTKDGGNFYIYMEDQEEENDFSFYVKGGETVTKNVPVGKYKIYYCSGDEWYGLEKKFGWQTFAQKSDKVLDFACIERNGFVQYGGHTIELYPVTNGNMPTKGIKTNDMPE